VVGKSTISYWEYRMNNHHQNARTTVFSRMLTVERVGEGMGVKEAAEGLGISRPTVYKWLARYRQAGEAALKNRISRPHKSPRRMPVERVATMAVLRGA